MAAQFEVKGEVTELRSLYCSSLIALGHGELYDYANSPELDSHLPVMTLEDLCKGNMSQSAYAGDASREVAKVGSWTSADELWEFSLVIAERHTHPLRLYYDSQLLLYVTCAIPSLPSTAFRAQATVGIRMREPDTVKTVKGYEIETKILGRMDTVPFDEFNRVRYCVVDRSEWTRTLKLWTRNFAHESFSIHFDVSTVVDSVPRPDFGVIGRFIQRQRDLLDLVVDQLSLRDVRALSLTSVYIAGAVATVPERRLRRAFEPYFPDNVDLFAAALRDHQAAVGGSTMLSVIQPGDWLPEDLDIIVLEEHVQGFVSFLSSQGYEEDKSRSTGRNPVYDGATFFGPDASVEFQYKCYIKKNQKIDICVIYGGRTPASFVLTYHSTAVMNYFDGRAIFCLFPGLTFEHRFMINLHTPTARLERGLNKVRIRGYEECPEEGGKRYVQDWLAHGPDGALRVRDLPTIWYQKVEV